MTCPIVFDLEFIGPVQSIRQCKIWEIALHCPLTKKDLQIVVDPDPSCKTFDPPPSKDLFHLTRAFLRKQNAEIFGSAFLKVQEFVDEQLRATNRAVALMISHNTFKSDKPLLEVECAKAGLPTPIHWYFFDSLHYFRKHPRCRSLKNFSLGSVSQHILRSEIKNRHRALADSLACTRIFHVLTKGQWNLKGPIYPFGFSSMRCVRWIGEKTEKALFMNHVHSLEELQIVVRKKVLMSTWTATSPAEALHSWLSGMFVHMPEENLNNIVTELLKLGCQQEDVFESSQ